MSRFVRNPAAQEMDCRYPDSGQMFEDANVLRNALAFTIAQRAYVADSLLHQPFDKMPLEVLAFNVLEAFGAEMTATEDTLGWIFALRDWRPGTAEKCLMANLDTVQVGRGNYDEQHAIDFLSTLDASRLRQVLHIPDHEALAKAGVSEELIAKVGRVASLDCCKFRRAVPAVSMPSYAVKATFV